MPLFTKKDLAAIAQKTAITSLPHLPIVQTLIPLGATSPTSKRRQFAPLNTLLADIIKSYGNNCHDYIYPGSRRDEP